MDDGDKQQETTATTTTTATRVIHEAAQARDGAERDRGQAGGLGTAVVAHRCMDKVRDKQSKICRGRELEMMTEVEVPITRSGCLKCR